MLIETIQMKMIIDNNNFNAIENRNSNPMKKHTKMLNAEKKYAIREGHKFRTANNNDNT